MFLPEGDFMPTDHDTRPFWIDPIIGAILMAQGLSLLFSNQNYVGLPGWIYGIVLFAAGTVWLWYHRSERFAVKAHMAASYWGLALIAIAMLLTMYDVYDRHFSVPIPDFARYSNAAKGAARLPLNDLQRIDDFADSLRGGVPANPGCEVLFRRLPCSTAEDFVKAIGPVLTKAGWVYRDKLTVPGEVPADGISVRPTEEKAEVYRCEKVFRNNLRMYAGVRVTSVPFAQSADNNALAMKTCEHPCIEVTVGNP
jgi:hypothetical protein